MAFYRDVLGLRVIRAPFDGTAFAGREAILSFRPGIGLCLQAHDDATGGRFDPTVTGLDHLAFAVDGREQLDDWHRRLTDLGVAHRPPRPLTDWGWFIELQDPDGIQIELHALQQAGEAPPTPPVHAPNTYRG